MANISAPYNPRTPTRSRVLTALGALDTIITGADTYLAIASPTNAQITAQVRALTQAVQVLARVSKRTVQALTVLSADRATIPADGVTAAVITWVGFDTTVTWDVSGASVTEATIDMPGDNTGLRTATLTLTATKAGALVVRVGDDTLVLTAT